MAGDRVETAWDHRQRRGSLRLQMQSPMVEEHHQRGHDGDRNRAVSKQALLCSRAQHRRVHQHCCSS